MRPVLVIVAAFTCASLFNQVALGSVMSVQNLTSNISGDARYPSLNNVGQVAWQNFLNGDDIDLYLDGTNITPGTFNEFNGLPSLNDSGNLAWQRWYSAASPLSGTYQVLLNGALVAGGDVFVAGGPQLNNAGQLAWLQWSGSEWDAYLDGVNLTSGLPGDVGAVSLNDSGQVAWQQYYGGQRDIYLDGINLTAGTDGDAYAPSLNYVGQVAWVQWTGNKFDVILDGVNVSSAIPGDVQQVSLNDLGQVAWWQFYQGEYDVFLDGVNLTDWTSEAAFHPSLNNRGQVAWHMGQDIYLASPVPEPPTLALLGLGFLGFVSLRRVNSARCLIRKYFKQSSVVAKPHIAIAFIAVMLSMALSPNTALAEVYKCKDAKGKITYSDSPCQKQAAQLPVDKSIQFENSAEGRHASAINKSKAESMTAQEVLGVMRRNAKEIGRYNDGASGATHDPLLNQGSGGQGVGSANRDFDVRMNAKRDYQKQQIPGFITHQPTDAHERGVYKQEMNRQKNMDPNTWHR